MKFSSLFLATSALVLTTSAPAAAQDMFVCTTVTITTIEYLSNGARIIDRHSYSVCYPL